MSVLITGYQMDKKIKDGGFSTVFEATRIFDKAKVALKVLSPEGMRVGWVYRSFRNEAKMLLGLEHPNVIKVYEYIATGARPAIVMELFDSHNLKHCVLKYHDRIRGRFLRIFVEISRALEYLHDEKIIHRDVKPENILVGEQGEVKLIDFSLAYRNTGWARWFRPRKLQGTPLYMSPEQIRRERIDHRSDIYALGCVFFEVLTRKPPFIATQEKLLTAHLTEKPVSPARYDKDIPQEMCELVLAMLRKKPEHRPANLGEVISVLESLEVVEA